MGIGDKSILAVGKDLKQTTLEMVDAMVDEDSAIVSIYFGSESSEEKAEEIAYRRQYPNEKFENVDKEKKTYFGSKILLEGLILINITIIVFCVQNKDEIFSENFLQRIASYQIDIKQTRKELSKVRAKSRNYVKKVKYYLGLVKNYS